MDERLSKPTPEEAAHISDVFKAYDIRGTTPDELTPDLAYRIGRALVAEMQPDEVAVGRDMRLSGQVLSAALIDGIRDGGADVSNLGLVSTDALYFAVGHYGYPAGVMVTASHNPAEYNGFKLCRDEAKPVSLDTGLGAIRDRVLAGYDPTAAGAKRGSVQQRNILDAYADYLLSLVDVGKIGRLKIAIDAGNGMAGLTAPKVFAKLPVEVVPLFFDLDGSFPNHPANPIEPANIVDLQRTVIEQRCDFGVAFDGDADRMFLVDERGAFVGGDMVTAMVAVKMLQQHPGSTIVYNLICSRSVPETIERLGGRAIRSRVGHSYIKALMRQEDAIFGGEHSGHFYFRKLWFADSGMLALLTVLVLVSEAGVPLSEVVRPLDTRVRSGEINSEVADPAGRMLEVERHFVAEGGEVDHLDGVTINFPTWWFNLRPSNTQPLLRLNVEANDRQTLDAKTREVLALVRASSLSPTSEEH
ncbi:MAG: phosphomannomutase/phosphoglucomutase [Thermomicrobiales bacterium]|nr:phosphomannomutase/phosphoglucomutase [Thermomicrobiales bacterium]